MGANHNDNITINISLDAKPSSQKGFSSVLLLTENVGGGFTERTRSYETNSDIDTDETSGDLTSTVVQALRDSFAQSPRIQKLNIGRS